MRFALATVALLALGGAAAAQTYGITVETAEDVDFSGFRTYRWAPGQGAFDRGVDRTIVSAVEGQLKGLGLAATADEPDVLVVYHALRRTDVDLDTWTKQSDPSKDPGRTYPVGTLVVNVLDPATSDRLWHARVDQPISLVPAELEAQIRTVVASMFERYPTRASNRR